MAVVRIFFRLGIIGKERFLFWKLLGWSLFRRRKNFVLAISLATYGYHFRKFFKNRF